MYYKHILYNKRIYWIANRQLDLSLWNSIKQTYQIEHVK